MNVSKEVYESREDMRNALKRIEAENKDLKEILIRAAIRAANYACEQFKALEDSRDELLELLNQLECFDDDDSEEWIRLPIRKAKALKEKS